jgi:hypothetical protein
MKVLSPTALRTEAHADFHGREFVCRLSKWMAILVGACGLCLLGVAACVAIVCSHTRSLENAIADAIGSPELVLDSPIAKWEERLGPPVTTEDGFFFYWPQHGVAVYTFPVYAGQDTSPEERRHVTSILIPLTKRLSQPYSLPQEYTCDMQFEELLDIRLGRNQLDAQSARVIRKYYLWQVDADLPRAKTSEKCVGLANIPHPLFARCILEFGDEDELVSLEIRLCDWWVIMMAD